MEKIIETNFNFCPFCKAELEIKRVYSDDLEKGQTYTGESECSECKFVFIVPVRLTSSPA